MKFEVAYEIRKILNEKGYKAGVAIGGAGYIAVAFLLGEARWIQAEITDEIAKHGAEKIAKSFEDQIKKQN